MRGIPELLADSAFKGVIVYLLTAVFVGSAAVSSAAWVDYLWVWPAATALHLAGAVNLRRRIATHPDLRLVDVDPGPAHMQQRQRARAETMIARLTLANLEVEAWLVPTSPSSVETRLMDGGRTVGSFPVGPVGTRWADLFRGNGVRGRVAGRPVRLHQERRRGIRRSRRILQIEYCGAIYQARMRGLPGAVVTTRDDGSPLSIEGASSFAVDPRSHDEVLLAFALYAVRSGTATESPLWRFSI